MTGTTEIMVDEHLGAAVVNETDVDMGDILEALQHQDPEVAAMMQWTRNVRRGSLIDRDVYVSPHDIYDCMRRAYHAARHDDVVSGVLESTEALAFAKMSIQCDDEDQEDVWNQIAADLDLDSRLREMWREQFTVSQVYVGVQWGRKDYKVGGKSPDTGIKRKKSFAGLVVPTGLTVLDPLKVVPVGNMFFNQDRLAYRATSTEAVRILAVLNGQMKDPVTKALIEAPYVCDDQVERAELAEINVDTNFLFLFRDDTVFRHTDTRSQYTRLAPVRLESVFELLDLKQQLRQMDRAHLLGGTNFIVLVRKGTDKLPAKPDEITHLRNNMRQVARTPIMVGDHRLDVEIVTPKTDQTLAPERYNGLDSRISARLFGMFATGNYAAGAKGDDSIKLARVVARGLESRRHMQRRALERYVLKPTFMKNDAFTVMPNMLFHPKRVSLDFDPALASFLLDLRDRGDLSRESILEEIDYDQFSEAQRRKMEAARYDDVFQTMVPFSGAQPGTAGGNTPAARSGGRTAGGRRSGGGAAPGTGQGQAPRNPAKKSDG